MSVVVDAEAESDADSEICVLDMPLRKVGAKRSRESAATAHDTSVTHRGTRAEADDIFIVDSTQTTTVDLQLTSEDSDEAFARILEAELNRFPVATTRSLTVTSPKASEQVSNDEALARALQDELNHRSCGTLASASDGSSGNESTRLALQSSAFLTRRASDVTVVDGELELEEDSLHLAVGFTIPQQDAIGAEIRKARFAAQQEADVALARKLAEEEEKHIEEERRVAREKQAEVAKKIANGTYEHVGGYTPPAVVALLVTLFRAAAFVAATTQEAAVRDRVLIPYPAVAATSYGDIPLNPAMPDYRRVDQIASLLPDFDVLTATPDFNTLKPSLDVGRLSPTPFALLRWIVNTNCSYLEAVPRALQISSLPTTHQFVMLVGSPEKEEAFQKLKAVAGSRWAFHGSRTENWHSILRNGLINMSGTSYQRNGAALGSGVYFAPDAGESIKYSVPIPAVASRAKAQSSTSTAATTPPPACASMQCLTLCEIIADKYADHGWAWTVQDESAIMTRMFFVFPNGVQPTQMPGGTCTTTNPIFLSLVERTVRGLLVGPSG